MEGNESPSLPAVTAAATVKEETVVSNDRDVGEELPSSSLGVEPGPDTGHDSREQTDTQAVEPSEDKTVTTKATKNQGDALPPASDQTENGDEGEGATLEGAAEKLPKDVKSDGATETTPIPRPNDAKSEPDVESRPGSPLAVEAESQIASPAIPVPDDQALVEKKVASYDSSDDDDGDGFRVVVGKETASTIAGGTPTTSSAAPTKRFLRGTNTLVNASSASDGTGGDKESNAPSKPASAAANIASLVPTSGAPVAASRPALKPGEYPPTAELQQSNGKTAFDVDIDGMEEQPWRHPGVDIADFFNYGFTEESWRVYCEKQLRNRYDQSIRRSHKKPVSARNENGGHSRQGGGSGTRRGGDQRNVHLHNDGAERKAFQAQAPTGNGWARGQGPEPFGRSFGAGPPLPGAGQANGPPQWFAGPPPQMNAGNFPNFGPAHKRSAVGGMMMNGNGMGVNGGAKRGNSPDPRDAPSHKIARMR